MEPLNVRTLASARATIIAEWGVLGLAQLQTDGSVAGPVILGPTWNARVAAVPVAGLLGWPVTAMPGVRYQGLFAGLGLGFGEFPNVPQ